MDEITTFNGMKPDNKNARKSMWCLSSIEVWERFSYYILLTLLPLYLVADKSSGGLGVDQASALAFYGLYLAGVQTAPLPGGIITDKWLGTQRAMFFGAILMLLGHVLLSAPHVLPLIIPGSEDLGRKIFYAALGLVACGNGLFKPNISVVIGRLPHETQAARDGAFTSFWMAVNIGAGLAIISGGLLSQKFGWYWAFTSAALGMAFALVLMVIFATDHIKPYATLGSTQKGDAPRIKASSLDWGFIVPLGVLLMFFLFYTAAYFQVMGAMNIFIVDNVDRNILGFEVLGVWLVGLNPIFMLFIIPPLSKAWSQGRGPAGTWPTSRKMAGGLILLALSFVLLLCAVIEARQGLASPYWIIGGVFVLTCAEIMFGPIMLAAVAKLSPPQEANVAMGGFLAVIGLGGLASGFIGALTINYGYEPVFISIIIGALVLAIIMTSMHKWFAQYGV